MDRQGVNLITLERASWVPGAAGLELLCVGFWARRVLITLERAGS